VHCNLCLPEEITAINILLPEEFPCPFPEAPLTLIFCPLHPTIFNNVRLDASRKPPPFFSSALLGIQQKIHPHWIRRVKDNVTVVVVAPRIVRILISGGQDIYCRPHQRLAGN
jgi:hypothetical protein